MKVKSLKLYELGGIIRKVGDVFEIPDHVAKQLIALKQAEILDDSQMDSGSSGQSTQKRTRSQPKE